MTNNMNYAIKHICVNGKLIMYKLIHKRNKNTYIRVNRQHEIEVIASPYIDETKLEAFIKQHIERMSEHVQKKQTKQLIDDQLNYIHIFGDKYIIDIVHASRKSYEIINHKIYIKLSKLDDKLALIKTIYQDKTAI
ncbi:hypothetical protein FACS1894166_10320 [Bacilli bacterium]|nr:hypothetical protein FACS1894166_10320 [Bacilli bacterium]